MFIVTIRVAFRVCIWARGPKSNDRAVRVFIRSAFIGRSRRYRYRGD